MTRHPVDDRTPPRFDRHGFDRRALLVLGLGCACLSRSLAQSRWPARPITLIVPFAPGGIADVTARAVTQAMSAELGQPFVIDNRPSAGSVVGSSAVAKASADGYTLLLLSNANAVSTGLFKKLPFDVVKDFVPITTLGFFDLGVFVSSESRLRSLGDVIREAKTRPGRLKVGTISVGSTQHLAAELFKTRAAVDWLSVPYKGTPAVVTALRSGEIDVAFEILGPMLPQLGDKAARILAVTSDKRHKSLPDVPTVIESGVPGYNVASWNGLAAPAGTPAAVVDRLNLAAKKALADPAIQQRLNDLGVRLEHSSPAQLGALLAGEIQKWQAVIKAAKIEPE